MMHPDSDKSLPLPGYDSPNNNCHHPSDAELAALLRSPPPAPHSPAPAYTALPYRDVDFHLAPLIHGRVGDIELETVDGKRFLVHKKVLEQETVFFHIYYGFVPVWRLQTSVAGPPHPNLPSHHAPVSPPQTLGSATTGAINNILCLPKLLASHLRPNTTSSPNLSQPHSTHDDNYDRPPRVPPKDVVTAPTPTTTPYTWAVPETSSVLAAFLYLVYPCGTFSVSTSDALPTLELTGRVIRAAMGYQASKALATARDRLSGFIDVSPIDVYAMATFFKFTDLARLASTKGLNVPSTDWSDDAKSLMGKSGVKRLEQLQATRMEGLRTILTRNVELDGHSEGCVRRPMMEDVWKRRVEDLQVSLDPSSELIELLSIDLRGGHCGDCLVLLGTTIQQCLLAAKQLPQST